MKQLTFSFLILYLVTFTSCQKAAQKDMSAISRNILEREALPVTTVGDNDVIVKDAVAVSPSTTYGCGNSAGGSFSGSGSHIYPPLSLDFSTAPIGASIEVDVRAASVPNLFAVGAGGSIAAQSQWLGIANYAGPWGNSLHASFDTSLFFQNESGKSYTLRVQTATQSNTDSWSANLKCNYPNFAAISFTNSSLSSTMTSTFTALPVNFATLSTTIGFSHTLTTSDIDFVHLYRTYDKKSDSSHYALSALFVQNSGSTTTKYCFTLYKDGSNWVGPTIVKTVGTTTAKYFPCVGDAEITTIANFATPSPTITVSTSSYMLGGGTFAPMVRHCGQATADCVTELYSNRGWGSVGLFVVTAFLPAIAAYAAGGCAVWNCVLN